ncbi:PREDICTED: phosphatidylinositide phosphatase SAC1-like [Priapulus caudatus]|uniref:Phosphatidylinositol-3-phosphatase SAC1 n=1 Tax=Priapulus caudatus TaxID=37621 RepID=A0ABM1E1S2_PRICU|nr:PREDICTED: phosphatidylinositide phosphatase SAC1-like [Priapulus caudatus]XP_014666150.1 PREDICTED: phosphatidylinositide phosphatase SAC1-like [Priapulus caudatus]
MAAAPLYEELRLHVTQDRFIIEPPDSSKQVLVIDRVSQDISLESDSSIATATTTSRQIFGVLGVVRLLAGPYLIVITKRSKVGELNGDAIYRVDETDMLSYKRTFFHLTEQQNQDNKTYLSMVQAVLQMPSFYFSYAYDLTHSLQRLQNTSPDFRQMALHERADARFVWNAHLLREFADQPELGRYTLPVMMGFVSVRTLTINKRAFSWALVSRRSCFRAGTRYYVRGVDAEGHAANFVETEQIVDCDGERGAFVQTRGSIPLYWSQRPNLRYKPTPVLDPARAHADGYNRHLDAQVVSYGRQVLINLIDHKGPEKLLERSFAGLASANGNSYVRYETFDFHHECRKMRWDRLSILMERIADDQLRLGYFHVLRGGQVVRTQEGVFRTNCIDCLDRTNVVQSMIARRCLEEQLTRFGVLADGQTLRDFDMATFIYNNVWADNADVCSIQYAGTGALKTDYTRMGKRTFYGLLKDGWNASIRYFINNFADGFRQDAMDLFLGNYVVEENEGITTPSPLQTERTWRILALPLVFVAALSMCIISLLIPSDDLREQLIYILFWGAASVGTLFFILLYGVEFVDKPKLAQAKLKTE